MLSSCGEKPKDEQQPAVEVQNVKTERKYQVSCQYNEKSQMTTSRGIITYEISRENTFSSASISNSLAPGRLDKTSQGSTKQTTKKTLADGKVEEKKLEFTFSKAQSNESRDLGKGLSQERNSVRTNRTAKPGFNFGLDKDQKPILTKNDSYVYESIMFYEKDKMQELSARKDGKVISPSPGIYEFTSKKEGKIKNTVYRLTEAVVDPMDENYKLISLEEKCTVEDVTPAPKAGEASGDAPAVESSASPEPQQQSPEEAEKMQNEAEKLEKIESKIG
ncbi:MAG: hypothetical protein K0R29_2859 [Pseudobdellovibrio sp.]|nr:hypothetical protein [Pseudobdellovibrio sp.]